MTVYKIAKNDEAVLKVEFFDDAESPRKSHDNLGTMVCWHPRYNLGDDNSYSDRHDFFYALADEIIGDTDKLETRLERNYEKGISEMETLMSIVEKSGEYIMLPLFLYDHSGITMNTTGFSCGWDTSRVGYVYVTKEELRKTYGVKRVTQKIIDKALKVMKAEVKTYDDYLTGSVYGFVLEDIEGNEINSCWGFFGRDVHENGIAEHIPSEYQSLVENLQYAI